jgi:hypothetical protein
LCTTNYLAHPVPEKSYHTHSNKRKVKMAMFKENVQKRRQKSLVSLKRLQRDSGYKGLVSRTENETIFCPLSMPHRPERFQSDQPVLGKDFQWTGKVCTHHWARSVLAALQRMLAELSSSSCSLSPFCCNNPASPCWNIPLVSKQNSCILICKFVLHMNKIIFAFILISFVIFG